MALIKSSIITAHKLTMVGAASPAHHPALADTLEFIMKFKLKYGQNQKLFGEEQETDILF